MKAEESAAYEESNGGRRLRSRLRVGGAHVQRHGRASKASSGHVRWWTAKLLCAAIVCCVGCCASCPCTPTTATPTSVRMVDVPLTGAPVSGSAMIHEHLMAEHAFSGKWHWGSIDGVEDVVMRVCDGDGGTHAGADLMCSV